MKIVVLDGYTLNPGDLDWGGLEQLGALEVHDRTAPEDIVARAEGADAVLVNKARLTPEMLQSLPELKYIGVLATGYDNVPVTAARERGIVVANVPNYGTHAVAQFTIGLMLELSQRFGAHDAAVKRGDWASCPDFCFTVSTLVELAGKTLGLVGLGAIGKQVARVAQAMDMRVLATGSKGAAGTAVMGVQRVELSQLLEESDIISLHCPLTPDTRQLINADRISQMKRTAMLINTARGALVQEEELAAALNSGRIAGAALDVLAAEPPVAGNPLLTARNCIITPHIAWAAYEARSRLLQTVVDNLQAFMQGKPINVVS